MRAPAIRALAWSAERPLLPRAAALALWGALPVFFALFLAGGSWMPAALLLGGVVLCTLALYSFKSVVYLWLIGTPTIFVFVNNRMRMGMAESVPVLSVERLLFMFIMAGFLAAVLLGRAKVSRPSRLEKWMLVFGIVLALSLLSTVPNKPFRELYKGTVLLLQGFVIPFAAFSLARNLRWREKDLRKFLLLLTVTGVYLSFLGALQYFFKMRFFVPLTALATQDLSRATGTLSSAVEYGMVLSAIVVLTFLQYSVTRDPLRRAFLLGAILLMGGGLFLCKTRAIWLALVAATAFLFRKDRRLRGLLLTMAITGTLALAALLPVILDSRLFRERIAAVSPILTRMAIYATAGNMILHHPLVGIGFGYDSFLQAKPDYIPSIGPAGLERYAAFPRVPHNEFLYIFALTGLAGFIPYLMVLLAVRRELVLGGRASAGGSPLRAGLAQYQMGVFVIFLINSLVSDMHTYWYFLALFYFLAGLAAAPGRGAEAEGRGAPA